MEKRISKFNKYSFLIWNLSFLLNIIWIIFIFFSLSEKQLYVYFNSDTLYLPSLFKDLFIDRTGISGWDLNAAPNFFPDMFFYFVINSIFSDFKTAMLVFSVCQYSVLLYLLNLVFKEVNPKVSWNHLALSNLLMLFFFYVTSIANDFSFTFYLLSISYHIGPFIMALLCFLYLLRYFKSENNSYLYAIFLLGFFAVFSNRLFIVMFVLPSLTVLVFLFNSNHKKKILKFLITLISFTALGVLGLIIVKNSGIIHLAGTGEKIFNFSNISGAFKIMASQHFKYVYLLDFRGIIVLLSLSSFVITSYIAITYLNKIFGKKSRNYNWIKAFYVFFFCAFFIIVLFMPVINGSYLGIAVLRYNIHVFYLAMFNWAFIVSYFIKNKKRVGHVVFKFAFIIFLSITLIYTILFPLRSNVKFTNSEFYNYYPEYIECADNLAEKNNLKYGVAEYWLAKKITMFSKQDLRVYTVFSDMKIWYHVMNRNWYYKRGKGKHGHPEFTFVIPNSLNKKSIIEHLGEPEQILDCSGTFKIWQYPEFEFDPDTRRPGLKKE